MPHRRYKVGLILFSTILALAGFSCLYADAPIPVAVSGILDLTDWNPNDTATISLDGEWAFYWDEIVEPDAGFLPESLEPDHFVAVPSYWDRLEELDPDITAQGVATYVLEILMPETFRGPLALKFLNVTPNAEIYIDGIQKAKMGNVDRDPNLSISGNRSLVIPLSCSSSSMTVSVSISNFHNVNGGLNRPVVLGQFEAIKANRESHLSHDALFLGGLLLMGLYQITLFLMHRKRVAPLFMAFLCLLAFFFSGFKHEMVLLAIFNGWDGEVRTTIIYLALALAPPAFTYYAYYLYPAHFKHWANRIIASVAVLFSVFILMTSKGVFTRLLVPLEIVLGLAAIYNLFSLIRGFIRSRDKQILLYLGGLAFLLLCILASMIDNAFAGFFESVAGVFFLFILYQAFLQAYIYSYAFREIDFLNGQKAKLEKRNVELFSLSYIDNLTGTCNRRLFDDFLTSNWRVGTFSGKSLGMILLDIDNFTDYNEFYGHRQGDLCLVKVCELVRDEMNRMGQDTLARYSGKEFAVIVSDIGETELYELAEIIRKAVEAGGIEHRSSVTAPVVTISLGCAILTPSIDEDPETLIDAADVALRQAKDGGRNQTVIKGAKPNSWEPRFV